MPLALQAQPSWDFSADAVVQRLRQDVYALASDAMEGREAGTEGERKAAIYIRQRMQQIGLAPLFDTTYYQTFTFPGPWEWGEDNHLWLGDQGFTHTECFFTLPGSAMAGVEAGLVYMGHDPPVQEEEAWTPPGELSDLIWIMEIYPPDVTEEPTWRAMSSYLRDRLEAAQEHAAAGVVFVNLQSGLDDPPVELRTRAQAQDFPVVFATRDLAHQLVTHAPANVRLATDIQRSQSSSLNVAGYIDNEAPYTVVIGGHFDHIGYGGRSSRSPGTHAIHYGADDNASGVAGMLEAARYFSQAVATNHNYLFIGFGAEEVGLLGSSYFVNSDAYDLDRINYMFNLDMIGRMEDERLALIGTGSSPAWEPLIQDLAPPHFQVRTARGGVGGSDHTSFYLKDIPVIFFYTGTHEDYHHPGDTPDKINYEGMAGILSFMTDMIKALDKQDKLAFSSTRDSREASRRAPTVSFGFMPDHTWEDGGLRILAVTDDRPAQRAGIQDGDIILRINDMEIDAIESYMEALGSLSAGTRAMVLVKRGEEELEVEVQL